jgi:uncharacterized protein
VKTKNKTILCKVHAKSRFNKTIYIKEKDYYKIYVNKPPENGKANKAVIESLSKHFKISKQNIKIISGTTNKIKKISICLLITSFFIALSIFPRQNQSNPKPDIWTKIKSNKKKIIFGGTRGCSHVN